MRPPDDDPPRLRHVAGAKLAPPGRYDADVVILALDRAEETVAAIRSVTRQTSVSRFIIVVDQGSRPEALARLAEAVNGQNEAMLVALDRNHGVPAGRNVGANLGHGRFIVGLDNDAVFDKADSLARMKEAFDADPDLAALGCRIVVDATGQDDLSSWGYPTALLDQSANTFETATFVGAGHAIRREAWEDAGGYDPRLFFCWEEYDFCLRAIAHFWRVRYRGDIVVRHKVSAERRVTWSGSRWFHYVRNRIYIGRKNGQSWPALAPRILGYCIKGVRNGCWRETPRALWAAIKMSYGVPHGRLPPVARDYLDRTDTMWRGGMLTRLRREVLASLPGAEGSPHITEASIRAITSAGGAPASAAAIHSMSS